MYSTCPHVGREQTALAVRKLSCFLSPSPSPFLSSASTNSISFSKPFMCIDCGLQSSSLNDITFRSHFASSAFSSSETGCCKSNLAESRAVHNCEPHELLLCARVQDPVGLFCFRCRDYQFSSDFDAIIGKKRSIADDDIAVGRQQSRRSLVTRLHEAILNGVPIAADGHTGRSTDLANETNVGRLGVAVVENASISESGATTSCHPGAKQAARTKTAELSMLTGNGTGTGGLAEAAGVDESKRGERDDCVLVRGLCNMGSTCFMNSILQVLLHNPLVLTCTQMQFSELYCTSHGRNHSTNNNNNNNNNNNGRDRAGSMDTTTASIALTNATNDTNGTNGTTCASSSGLNENPGGVGSISGESATTTASCSTATVGSSSVGAAHKRGGGGGGGRAPICICCEFKKLCLASRKMEIDASSSSNGSEKPVFRIPSHPLIPSNLLYTVWTHANFLAGYEQHDAHEFLMAFLDGLDSHLDAFHGGRGAGSPGTGNGRAGGSAGESTGVLGTGSSLMELSSASQSPRSLRYGLFPVAGGAGGGGVFTPMGPSSPMAPTPAASRSIDGESNKARAVSLSREHFPPNLPQPQQQQVVTKIGDFVHSSSLYPFPLLQGRIPANLPQLPSVLPQEAQDGCLDSAENGVLSGDRVKEDSNFALNHPNNPISGDFSSAASSLPEENVKNMPSFPGFVVGSGAADAQFDCSPSTEMKSIIEDGFVSTNISEIASEDLTKNQEQSQKQSQKRSQDPHTDPDAESSARKSFLKRVRTQLAGHTGSGVRSLILNPVKRFRDIFTGSIESQLVCMHCGQSSSKTEGCIDLSLSVEHHKQQQLQGQQRKQQQQQQPRQEEDAHKYTDAESQTYAQTPAHGHAFAEEWSSGSGHGSAESKQTHASKEGFGHVLGGSMGVGVDVSDRVAEMIGGESSSGSCTEETTPLLVLEESDERTSHDDSTSEDDAVTLEECLAYYTSTELLSSQVRCEKCEEYRDMQKQLSISAPTPNILVLQLKRFDFLYQRKIDRVVQFRLRDFDIAPFTAQHRNSAAITHLSSNLLSKPSTRTHTNSSTQTCQDSLTSGSGRDSMSLHTNIPPPAPSAAILPPLEGEEAEGLLCADPTLRAAQPNLVDNVQLPANFCSNKATKRRSLNGIETCSGASAGEESESVAEKSGNPRETLYDLQGLVTHKGSLTQGHYIAYVRDFVTTSRGLQRAQWFRCDDETVEAVDEEEVQNSEGYLLFYLKKSFIAADE